MNRRVRQTKRKPNENRQLTEIVKLTTEFKDCSPLQTRASSLLLLIR